MLYKSLKNFLNGLSSSTKWAVAGTALVVGGLVAAYFVKQKQKNEKKNTEGKFITFFPPTICTFP